VILLNSAVSDGLTRPVPRGQSGHSPWLKFAAVARAHYSTNYLRSTHISLPQSTLTFLMRLHRYSYFIASSLPVYGVSDSRRSYQDMSRANASLHNADPPAPIRSESFFLFL